MTQMNQGNLMGLVNATTWALQPEYLQHVSALAEFISRGGASAERAIDGIKAENEIQAARRQQIAASTGGAVAVLPLYGMISQRSSWMSYYFGGTSTEQFTLQLRQAIADPNVTAIVIDVDSPGGCVSGVDELAAEIYASRGKKTIVAVSNTLNASAAYYLASQASELYVSPSSLTGSIGVYNTHQDLSKAYEDYGVKMTLISAGKYKVEGNSYEPLTPEALAAAQKLVDGFYAAFVKAVARGRGVKAAAVQDGFGQGRVVMAAEAVALGMADKIGTLDTVLARFGVKRTGDEGSYASLDAKQVPDAETKPAAPVAAAKADDDVDDSGGDGNDDDNPCECPCDPCMKSECEGCTADDCDADGCTCAAAKKSREKAADTRRGLVALEKQRVWIALHTR